MDDRTNKPWDDCYRNSYIDCDIRRTKPAIVTLELKQPCGICGYIASNDTVYINKDGKEVQQYLCNDCAPELTKNFKFISVKEI